MEKTTLIIPTSAINENDAWQTFLSLHKLRGQGNTEQTRALYAEWRTKTKFFTPFQPMPISPSNLGHNPMI